MTVTKLKPIYGGLRPRERAQLILSAWLAAEQPDPGLRTSADPGDWNTAARLIAETRAAWRELGGQLEFLAVQVEVVELRWLLEEPVRGGPDEDEEDVGPLGRARGAEERAEHLSLLRCLLAARWRTLGLIERSYDAFSAQVELDVVEPRTRRILDELRGRLRLIQVDLEETGDCGPLPEPEDEEVRRAVEWVKEQR